MAKYLALACGLGNGCRHYFGCDSAALRVSRTNRLSPSYNARLPSCANGLSTREHPMPLNVPITEEMVRGLAPDDATWNKATELAGSERLVNAGISADGT